MLRALFLLFRIPNLILLVCTIYIVARRVIYPPLIKNNILSQLTNNDFYHVLFIISCIGAGGYLHNDIIDAPSDRANGKHPIIGTFIHPKIGIILYWFLTIAPLLGIFSLVLELERPSIFWGYIIIVGLFWLYNRYLQNITLIGNATVALLCAIGVSLPYFIEWPSIIQLSIIDYNSFIYCKRTILMFAIFAFGSNFIREIIKDLEDQEGDRMVNQKTLPLKIGQARTIQIATILSIVFGVVATIILHMNINLSVAKTLLTSCLLIIPLSYIIWKTQQSKDKLDFHKLSILWKLYFLCGLIVLILIT